MIRVCRAGPGLCPSYSPRVICLRRARNGVNEGGSGDCLFSAALPAPKLLVMFSKGLPVVYCETLLIWGNILPIGEMSIRGDARKDTVFIVILKMDKCLNKLE